MNGLAGVDGNGLAGIRGLFRGCRPGDRGREGSRCGRRTGRRRFVLQDLRGSTRLQACCPQESTAHGARGPWVARARESTRTRCAHTAEPRSLPSTDRSHATKGSDSHSSEWPPEPLSRLGIAPCPGGRKVAGKRLMSVSVLTLAEFCGKRPCREASPPRRFAA